MRVLRSPFRRPFPPAAPPRPTNRRRRIRAIRVIRGQIYSAHLQDRAANIFFQQGCYRLSHTVSRARYTAEILSIPPTHHMPPVSTSSQRSSRLSGFFSRPSAAGIHAVRAVAYGYRGVKGTGVGESKFSAETRVPRYHFATCRVYNRGRAGAVDIHSRYQLIPLWCRNFSTQRLFATRLAVIGRCMPEKRNL